MAIGFAEFLYEEAERRNSNYEETCPHCSNCGEPIYDDYAWEINGEVYCEDCMNDFRVSTEELMER